MKIKLLGIYIYCFRELYHPLEGKPYYTYNFLIKKIKKTK